MKYIKQKGPVCKTVKAIDKGAIAGERMKDAFIRTKEQSEESYSSKCASPTEYTADSVSHYTDRIKDEIIHRGNQVGHWGFDETKHNIQKGAEKLRQMKADKVIKSAKTTTNTVNSTANNSSAIIREQGKSLTQKNIKNASAKSIKTLPKVDKTIKQATKGVTKSATKSVKTIQKTTHATIKTAQATTKASVKTAKTAAQTAKVTAKAVATTAKSVAKATVVAVKAIIASIKSLVAAIAAGGWVAVIIILVICMVPLVLNSGQTITSTSSMIPIYRFDYPLPQTYSLNSYFGYRSDPYTGETSYHSGVDIGAPERTPILASDAGIIIKANFSDAWGGGFGYYVEIEHSDGYKSFYAHCFALSVVIGQQVQKGEVIGYVGTTGRSTGNHLHFEIIKDGERVDPLSFFTQ